MGRASRLALAAVMAGGAWAIRDWWWPQREEEGLAGRVALVTGGSRGLGFLLAREFGREGCRVAICARDPQELAAAAEDLRALGVQALTVRCDVTDVGQVERMIAEVTEKLGRVDILVNNA